MIIWLKKQEKLEPIRRVQNSHQKHSNPYRLLTEASLHMLEGMLSRGSYATEHKAGEYATRDHPQGRHVQQDHGNGRIW